MLPRVPEDSLGSLLFISSTLIFTASIPSVRASSRLSNTPFVRVGRAADLLLLLRKERKLPPPFRVRDVVFGGLNLPDENFTLPLRLLKEVGCVGVKVGMKVVEVALMVRLLIRGERESDSKFNSPTLCAHSNPGRICHSSMFESGWLSSEYLQHRTSLHYSRSYSSTWQLQL